MAATSKQLNVRWTYTTEESRRFAASERSQRSPFSTLVPVIIGLSAGGVCLALAVDACWRFSAF